PARSRPDISMHAASGGSCHVVSSDQCMTVAAAGRWCPRNRATAVTAVACTEGVSLSLRLFVGAIAVEAQAITTPSTPAELAAGIDYFFAVRPDDQARSAIADAAARFRKAQRVSGVAVPLDSLHLSLCPMGRPERLRQPLEQALLAAGAEVRATGFLATLDAAMRCISRDGQFPLCYVPTTPPRRLHWPCARRSPMRNA